MPADVRSKKMIAYSKDFFNSAQNSKDKSSIRKNDDLNRDRRIQLGENSIATDIKDLYKTTAQNVAILESEIGLSQALLSKGCAMACIDKNPMEVSFDYIIQNLSQYPARISNANVILCHNNALYFADFKEKSVRKVDKSAPCYAELFDHTKQLVRYSNVADQKIMTWINAVTNRKHECIETQVYVRAQANVLYNSILLSHYAQYYVDKVKSANANAAIANIIHKTPLNEAQPRLFSFTNLRNFMWYLNGYRLSGVFSKLTTIEFMELAKQYALIDLWNNVYAWGWHIHFDPQAFDHVTKVLNISSVLLYSVTFSAHMLIISKHLIFGSEVEKSIGIWEQIKHEAWKRQYRLGNDGAWALINLLTNFNKLFGITSEFANKLTAVFVLLDLVWLMRLHYVTLKPLYEQQEIYIEMLSKEQDPIEKAFIQQQLALLEVSIDKNNYVFKIFTASSMMYITGFCLSLTSQALPVITAGFFLCTLAMAVGLSYKSMVAFKFAEDHETMTASRNMISDLTENTFMPILFMTAYSINLPAALLLTVAYLYYKMPPDTTPKEDPTLAKLEDETAEHNITTASTYFITPVAV